MLRILVGIFLILHGGVYGLYAAHSGGAFELTPGMTWPEGAWGFSRWLSPGSIRSLALVACILAGVLFAAGGSGLLLKQTWWSAVTITAILFSSVLYLLLWDGSLNELANQGGIALLINVALLAGIWFKWIKF